MKSLEKKTDPDALKNSSPKISRKNVRLEEKTRKTICYYYISKALQSDIASSKNTK